MDFQFSEEQKMLRGLVKEFADSEIRPLAKKIDEVEEIPKELIKKLAEIGFLGTAFP
jgi:butyryl-CoA dehydrogenase